MIREKARADVERGQGEGPSSLNYLIDVIAPRE
jgi:hypothetical protein